MYFTKLVINKFINYEKQEGKSFFQQEKSKTLKLIFAEAANGFELTNIPVVPAALSISMVMAVLGAIYGLVMGIMTGDVVLAIIWLISYAISWFVMYFIMIALATVFYNFLQPRIGGIKLVLE